MAAIAPQASPLMAGCVTAPTASTPNVSGTVQANMAAVGFSCWLPPGCLLVLVRWLLKSLLRVVPVPNVRGHRLCIQLVPRCHHSWWLAGACHSVSATSMLTTTPSRTRVRSCVPLTDLIRAITTPFWRSSRHLLARRRLGPSRWGCCRAAVAGVGYSADVACDLRGGA